jgi:hypothetical protein
VGKEAKPCLTFSEIMCGFKAYVQFISENFRERCSRECPLECERQTFSYETRFLAYPSHGYYNYLMQQPDVVSKFGMNASEITYEKMRNSILRMNIFYDSLSYTKVQETIKVQIFDVVSGIGGTLVKHKS